jgi:hypothetical protein
MHIHDLVYYKLARVLTSNRGGGSSSEGVAVRQLVVNQVLL